MLYRESYHAHIASRHWLLYIIHTNYLNGEICLQRISRFMVWAGVGVGPGGVGCYLLLEYIFISLSFMVIMS